MTALATPAGAPAQPATVEDRILEGAARCFTDVGVRKTTVAEIAAAAGITKPTFYRRFADKSDVVEALVRRETDDLARRMRDAGSGTASAADAFTAAFRTASRWLTRHPFVRKSLDLEPELLMPYLNQPDGPVLSTGHAVFAELVARGAETGEFRDVDPADVAEVCWRLVLSFALTPLPDEARIDDLVRATLLEGVASPVMSQPW
ncbi:MAG TPA: TetR/AcrR family transcriptional regulator [Frankiaceae bacterium]|nr:TetR/AcrR family transcriptional regulator [Frankiaceae bacterium]